MIGPHELHSFFLRSTPRPPIRHFFFPPKLPTGVACAAGRWSAVLVCLSVLRVSVPAQVFSPALDKVELQEVRTIPPLLHNVVTGIVQDHRGYIWITGYARLYRYDGFQFQCFSNTVADTLLQRWTYRGLAGARHGILCIYGSGNEVVLYDVDGASTHLYQLAPEQSPEVGSAHISFALEDSCGRFLIATREGIVYRIDPRTAEVKTLNGQPGSAVPTGNMPVTALAEDSRGTIWAGGEKGIVRVSRGSEEIDKGDSLGPMAGILPPDSVAVMRAGSDGRIWVGTLGGEFGIIDPARRSFICMGRVKHRSQRTPVTAFLEDPFGNIWIGTHDGLDQWRPKQGTEPSYFCRNAHLPGTESTITVLSVDRTGLLWVGMAGKGFCTYAPWRRKFHSCTPSGGALSGLSSTFVSSAVLDRGGTLWVGTAGYYLNYLPYGSGRFRQVCPIPGDTQALLSGRVVCVCQRGNGDLWFGTAQGGICVLRPHTKTFARMRHSPGNPGSLGADTVNAVFEDNDRTVWVGHWRGVDRYEDRTGKFSPFIRWPEASLGRTGTVGYFYRDSKANFWIATAGRGLLRIGRTPGDSVWYRHEPGRAGTLPSNFVDCLREDELGRLWLGTYAGLSRFDHSSAVFHTYSFLSRSSDLDQASRSARYSPPDLAVAGIVPDRMGNLWLSTNAGLARFNVTTGVGRLFGDTDGMVVKEGMRHAMFTTPDGWIYCGGRGGLIWFHPDSLMENPTSPPIVITDFGILGGQTVSPAIGPRGVSLDHTENTFSIRFAALDYTDPQQNQFMYMWEGADQNWVSLGTDPNVAFAGLHPGSYILRVQASNSDGVWNETGLTLPIVIRPPYWQTWWFRVLAAALFAALLYALYRFQLSKKLQLERMRVDIARDLHDEIGTSLSSIALSSELVQRNLPPDGAESNLLSDVVRAARTMADRTRDIVWVLAPEHERLSDLVLRMRSEASRLLPAAETAFATNQHDPDKQLDMELRRHLLLMFKEILHNIARHSGATHVQIRIDQHDDTLRLSIDDNGVGFNPSNATTGYGLQSLRERAKKIGAALEIRSNPGEGTSVSVEIPDKS